MERAFGGQNGHGRWWNNPKVADRLKLTDDQRKAFDGIFLEHREKLIDLKAVEEKAELEMEPLVRADQPDEGRILAQIDKVAQARAELEKANARFLLAIRSKLTPDQWKQIQAFRAERGAEHEGWKRDGHERDGHGPYGHGPDGRGQVGPGPGGQYQYKYHHRAPAPPPAPDGSVPPAPGAASTTPSGSGDEQ
jgi:Spy/CpxP family protein refolding chaperone